MKYVLIFLIPFLLLSLYGSCGNGGGDQDTINRCFSELSSNPCFDENEGGSTSSVNDRTIGEIIQEQENRPDFLRQLDFNEIVRTLGRSIFLPFLPPECRWEDSGLVIKTQHDWNRFRNSCFFKDNIFDIPDVNFSENMVIISLKGTRQFGTEVVTILEFGTELIAVITDTNSDLESSEARFFGSSVVEVVKRDVPVSFIRVEDVCNSVFNFPNSECLAESLLNRCENTPCSFLGGTIDMTEPNCTALDCTSVSCEEIEIGNFNIDTVSGIITDITLMENNLLPEGIINVDGEDRVVSCTLVVE